MATAVRRPTLARRSAAEGVAAFALVFAGCGAVVADHRYGGALGTVGVGMVFGLVVPLCRRFDTEARSTGVGGPPAHAPMRPGHVIAIGQPLLPVAPLKR